jgi:pilus assembly protein CpaE
MGLAGDEADNAGGKSAAKKGDSLLGKIGDFKNMIPSRRKDKATALEG